MDRNWRLCPIVTDEGSKPETLSRIAQMTAALTRLIPVCNDRSISLSSKMLPQDTMHLMQRPCNQWRCISQDLTGNRITWRPLTIVKRCKLKWYGHVSNSSSLPKPSSKAQWKGEEDKADRGRSGKVHQGMDRPGVHHVPKGSGEQRKNGRNWLWSHTWCPNEPHGIGEKG